MRVLIVAATEHEVENLMPLVSDQKSDLTILITGVGMVATAFIMGHHLAINHYDLAINLGIAGSFDRNIALGDVVEVVEDTFSELGAEDDKNFLTIDQLGFGNSKFLASTNINTLLSDSHLFKIKKASAITVNTVHGNDLSIKRLTNRIQPQLENMEGAAFFYSCNQAGVSCMQIRAVSNYVEKRNRDNWNIGLAIKNLNNFAVELIKEIAD